MSKKKSNRGLEPTPLTIHILCARAAGRCEYSGCGKILFTDQITLEEFNNTNIAHIVASSPNGPRGDIVRSHQLSQDINNLMLMCLDHHKLIDQKSDEYSEQKLIEMKQKHEESVSELCETICFDPTEILMFSSPIKGKIPVNIDYKSTVSAIVSQNKPASAHGIAINIESASDYRAKEYWAEVEKQLHAYFNYNIKSILSVKPQSNFSVFPIAPIPLIIKLGYMFGDKIQASIFQKTRNPNTWNWLSNELSNSFEIIKKKLSDGSNIALIISLTADISVERVTASYDANIIYIIKATKLGVDSIRSIEDLSEFWHIYQQVCDNIKHDFPLLNSISLFPAIPVSAAFEIGRRFMNGIYPKLKIYDDDNGFFETITVGGND